MTVYGPMLAVSPGASVTIVSTARPDEIATATAMTRTPRWTAYPPYRRRLRVARRQVAVGGRLAARSSAGSGAADDLVEQDARDEDGQSQRPERHRLAQPEDEGDGRHRDRHEAAGR